jgi:hypothetical protein
MSKLLSHADDLVTLFTVTAMTPQASTVQCPETGGPAPTPPDQPPPQLSGPVKVTTMLPHPLLRMRLLLNDMFGTQCV